MHKANWRANYIQTHAFPVGSISADGPSGGARICGCASKPI